MHEGTLRRGSGFFPWLLACCMPATALTAQVWPGPQWRQEAPIGSFNTAAMYSESATNALFVFGGDGAALTTWRWLGTWQQVVTPAAPSLRSSFGFAYDAARNVAVVFGGLPLLGQLNDETWEFDGATWSLRQFPVAPAARSFPAMAYDPLRQRVVMHGGTSGSSALGDTWEYDGVAWTQVSSPNGPGLADGPQMAFASNLQKILYVDGNGPTLRTWTYDGVNWLQLTPATPVPARSRPRLVHDVARSRTVLYGGFSASQFLLMDTWEFDGSDWHAATTTTAPVGLYMRGMAYSPLLGGIVSHGGYPGGIPAATATAQLWNGLDWVQIAPEYPFFRGDPEIAYDSARDCLVLHGGRDTSGAYVLETWEWHQGTWTRTAVGVGPQTQLAYDPKRQCVVAVDGTTTWEYGAGGWLARQLTPSPPTGFVWYDRHDGVVKLATGTTVWRFDGSSWQSQAAPGGSSFRRVVHFAARDRAVATSASSIAVFGYDGATWSSMPPPTSSLVFDLVEDVFRGVLLGFDPSNGEQMWFDGTQWFGQSAGGTSEGSPLRLTADAVTGRVFGVSRTGNVWVAEWPNTASLARYGRGCPGSGGVPLLDRVGPTTPLLGQLLPLRLSSLPLSPGLSVLALGDSISAAAGQPLPLSLAGIGLPECQQWTSVLATAAVPHAGVATTFTLPLPANPSLAGVLLAFQTFVLDQAAANGIGSVSNAVLVFAR